jgi:glutamate dehydrogenase
MADGSGSSAKVPSPQTTGYHPSLPSVEQAQAMLGRIQHHILGDLEATVRWFYAQMPTHYFQVTTQAEQALHLEMMHLARRADEPRLSVIDDHANGKLLVFGKPDRHSLLDVMALIETRGADTKGFSERLIRRVELHTSRDRTLFLYAFCYGAEQAAPAADLAAHRAAVLLAVRDDAATAAAAERYLDAVDQGYLARSTVERVVRHIRAWSRLRSDDDIQLMHDRDAHGDTRLLVATASVTPWELLGHWGRVVARYKLSLARGYLDYVPAIAGEGKAIIATVYVNAAGGAQLADAALTAVEDDLRQARLQYHDGLVAKYVDGTYTLDQLGLLRAAIGFASYQLAHDYPYLDVGEVGEEALSGQVELCRELWELAAARFRPNATVSASDWQTRFDTALAKAHAVEPRSHAAVLEGMLAFIGGIRLTNLFRPRRLGMAFKLDPSLLPEARWPHRPFGIFYFFGPQARGFHVRFRASARGGLRVLIPRNSAQYERARDGVLREVYDLAWAQQLKNKDIPEGGSKCIALVEPGGSADGAVKQVADSLLDLILPPEMVPEVVGAHGERREADLIFLGPDENMTPERITWVAHRANERGLPHAATLMSSKPGSGINHKEFGVTSEGIFRWITMVLPLVGIVEGQPYTVKMTGGPDGDVGGNLLKVLRREHGVRCRVVAIGDGTGSAQDPAGLDWDELARLVTESQGIARFNPAKLSPQGRVVPATDKAGEAVRNELHNVIAADLFVPCGGRPYSINDDNWKRFLSPEGKPTARAMVEGANIFLTAGARRHLEDAGLVVIKDSSANKGGVICSSYEVLAGLVLSDEEFLAVKPRYVAEVIEIIRERAKAEAQALIAAWKRRGQGARLSDLSQQLSEEINRVSGLVEPAILAHLDDAGMVPTWERHLHAHCPPLLVERWRDRLMTRIPRAHRVAILSKRLASRMVYKEGLTWCRTYLTDNRLWDTLSTYLSAETRMREVAERLLALGLPGGEELVHVIASGAQRELVRRQLGQEF